MNLCLTFKYNKTIKRQKKYIMTSVNIQLQIIFFCYISSLEADYLLKRVTGFKKLKSVISEENQYVYYLHQAISKINKIYYFNVGF